MTHDSWLMTHDSWLMTHDSWLMNVHLQARRSIFRTPRPVFPWNASAATHKRQLEYYWGCERWVQNARGATCWRGSSCTHRCDNRDIYIRKRDMYVRKEICKRNQDVSDGFKIRVAWHTGEGRHVYTSATTETYIFEKETCIYEKRPVRKIRM